MSLSTTPNANRVHIGIFGRRNAGKSSVINAITSQNLAIVSDVPGTTTDPVSKAMELLPLGPVVIIDTPGLDDIGELGALRIEKAVQVLNKTDIALVVVNSLSGVTSLETQLIEKIKAKKIPYIVVVNKLDLSNQTIDESIGKTIYVSSKTGENIKELKELIAHIAPTDKETPIVSDLINENDIVVLVIPIDESAPKGRVILPQQQVLREVLDCNAIAVSTQVTSLAQTLNSLSKKPKLVITDSQAFGAVSKIVPEDIILTSFSILFARHKGELDALLNGTSALSSLEDGDTVLISEGCTHHRQCNDIGTVKIPRWVKNYTGKDIKFEYSSGTEFPAEKLTNYKMVIHCGGCMLNEREMKHRISVAKEKNIPIVNYGMLIAHINGILKRSLQVFEEL